MSNTNDMHREFEAWFAPTFISDCQWNESRNCYVEYDCHMAWKGWQAATERATALERERCAVVCESRFMGDLNREDLEARRCADAIRKGGKV